MRKSFYTLELFIMPGGGRKAHVYVLSSLEEIKSALEVELSERWDLSLLLSYGEHILLTAYIEGKPVSTVNLLPYISVELEGQHVIQLNEDSANDPPVYESESDDEETYEKETEIYNMVFGESGDYDDLNFKVYVDWSKIVIPQLKEPVIEKGDMVLVLDHYYMEGGSEAAKREITDEMLDKFSNIEDEAEKHYEGGLHYGWQDTELGEYEDDLDEDSPLITRKAEINRVIFR